uniref:Post-SET domain-containing protein n=1 Tax=Astyanax mexicanus TaxID=7994 RepID=A0A3B1JFF8_ASTMX
TVCKCGAPNCSGFLGVRSSLSLAKMSASAVEMGGRWFFVSQKSSTVAKCCLCAWFVLQGVGSVLGTSVTSVDKNQPPSARCAPALTVWSIEMACSSSPSWTGVCPAASTTRVALIPWSQERSGNTHQSKPPPTPPKPSP